MPYEQAPHDSPSVGGCRSKIVPPTLLIANDALARSTSGESFVADALADGGAVVLTKPIVPVGALPRSAGMDSVAGAVVCSDVARTITSTNAIVA